MRPGYQTVIWGPRIDNFDYVLDVIANAGFEGVELSQRPDHVSLAGKPVESIGKLLDLLSKHGLELAGLSGGTLRERMDFCEEYRGCYLYTEQWDEESSHIALDLGFTLALHPHMFTPTRRLTEAFTLLEQHSHPGFRFLPDTAHLTIVGDDPCKALEVGIDRLAAVHIKDWVPEFGRFSHRYALGFTELGSGEVQLDQFLDQIEELGYRGWVIVDQDNTRLGPAKSIAKSAQWLYERCIIKRPPEPSAKAAPPWGLDVDLPDLGGLDRLVGKFLLSIMKAGTERLDSCYDSIAEAFWELLPCNAVSVWTYSPVQDRMSLLCLTTIRIPA